MLQQAHTGASFTIQGTDWLTKVIAKPNLQLLRKQTLTEEQSSAIKVL